MPHPRVDNSDLLDRIDQVSAKLAECINLAQTTLDEYGVPYFKNRPVTRSHNPQSDDIFAHLDRVDSTLLDCIKLAENTLKAKEYNTHENALKMFIARTLMSSQNGDFVRVMSNSHENVYFREGEKKSLKEIYFCEGII